MVHNQSRDLKRSLYHLSKEGFRKVYVIKSPEDAENVEITRVKLWSNKKNEKGPFDIVGDVHGCYDELCTLLVKLGYSVEKESCKAAAPDGRKAVFLGDLCDRGPKNVEVLRLVMFMVEKEDALCLPGNHDTKLLKHLNGQHIQVSHGLENTIKQLADEPVEFIEQVKMFLNGLISHYILDDGRLVTAHAGIKEAYHGRSSEKIRECCIYGETTGEHDEYGLPELLNWAKDYRGQARVIYGHIPGHEVQSLNNTHCIDTGCVFGGKLTAYRYPENEFVDTPALMQYYEPTKPLIP